MNKAMVLSIVRSLLIGLGAYAVGRGWLSESVVAEVVAALMSVAAAVWGAVDKKEG